MSENTDMLTVVVEYEEGDEAGGGAYEFGSAPRFSARLANLIDAARREASALVAGGYEWASVFVGVGGVEDVHADSAELSFSYPA